MTDVSLSVKLILENCLLMLVNKYCWQVCTSLHCVTGSR